MVKVFVFKFSLAILHFMDEQVELPKFTEEKRIDSHQVIMAKYSHDGKVLATVNVDYSISIWDSHDILVDTYELSFFHTRGNTRQNSYHAIFLDWSASSKYLYYRQCIVTWLDRMIELYIKTDSHTHKMCYRDLIKLEATKKGVIPSYAQYTDIDGLILLWLNGNIFLINDQGQVVRSVAMKQSQPLQHRIHIDTERRICIVACRNELYTLSLPDLEVISSYRDSVNDSPWRAIDYFHSCQVILAIPENFVLDGPVFYLLTAEGELEVSICRDPKQRLFWGEVHPSGRSILFCSEQGELILFRLEEKGFQWHVRIRVFIHFLGTYVSLQFYLSKEK